MEDFSFPTVVLTDRDSSSSSLWFFHSPEADADGRLRRSFSEGVAAVCSARALRRPASPAAFSDCAEESAAALEFDERMDLLWEDFNEELFRGGSLDGQATPPEKISRRRSSSLGIEGLAVVAAERSGLVAAKKEQRRRGQGTAMVAALEMRLMEVSKSAPLRHRRKPGLVVMLRMLKKLFVAQKTRSTSSKQQI